MLASCSADLEIDRKTRMALIEYDRCAHQYDVMGPVAHGHGHAPRTVLQHVGMIQAGGGGYGCSGMGLTWG